MCTLSNHKYKVVRFQRCNACISLVYNTTVNHQRIFIISMSTQPVRWQSNLPF